MAPSCQATPVPRGNNRGGEWYVENVFEELDSPNEYFYNESTHVLYYYHNASGAPPASMHFEAAVNQVYAPPTPLHGLYPYDDGIRRVCILMMMG